MNDYFFNSIKSKKSIILEKEKSANHYVQYMLARTQSIFKYENLPKTIPQRMLELLLQSNGYVCVANVNNELYAFNGGLGGEPDVYYMPTVCTVANPALNFSANLKIDTDCIIIPSDSMYLGLLPMFSRYAVQLVENDISIRVADINLRVTGMIKASNDSAYNSAKKFIDDIEVGKLSTIYDNAWEDDGVKSLPFGDRSSSNTITQLIELQQYLKAGWYNDIGLDSNYNMKREITTTSENDMNNDALVPLIDDMLECRKLGIEKVNKMFGTNISVNLNSVWKVNEKEIVQNPLENEQSTRVEIGGENNNE